jgi:hypothetical protein
VAVGAFAKDKCLLAYGMVYYFEVVKKKPTFTEWAFSETFRHFIFLSIQ